MPRIKLAPCRALAKARLNRVVQPPATASMQRRGQGALSRAAGDQRGRIARWRGTPSQNDRHHVANVLWCRGIELYDRADRTGAPD
jgi:hypothetical protein